MGGLAKIFKAPKPDNRALLAQQQRVEEQEKRIARDEASQKEKEAKRRKSTRLARQGAQGSRSLLSGLETGVQPERRDTLG